MHDLLEYRKITTTQPIDVPQSLREKKISWKIILRTYLDNLFGLEVYLKALLQILLGKYETVDTNRTHEIYEDLNLFTDTSENVQSGREYFPTRR